MVRLRPLVLGPTASACALLSTTLVPTKGAGELRFVAWGAGDRGTRGKRIAPIQGSWSRLALPPRVAAARVARSGAVGGGAAGGGAAGGGAATSPASPAWSAWPAASSKRAHSCALVRPVADSLVGVGLGLGLGPRRSEACWSDVAWSGCRAQVRARRGTPGARRGTPVHASLPRPGQPPAARTSRGQPEAGPALCSTCGLARAPTGRS